MFAGFSYVNDRLFDHQAAREWKLGKSRALKDKRMDIELLEMERNRKYAACCGSGGGVGTAFPELAHAIGQKRRDMAIAVGADLMVTSCPWCRQNLSDSMEGGGYRVSVKDVLEIAAASLV